MGIAEVESASWDMKSLCMFFDSEDIFGHNETSKTIFEA